MPLDEFTRSAAQEKLKSFCDEKVPPEVRDRLKITFGFWHDSALIYEERPVWNDPSRWTKMKIARMDFNPETMGWTLYAYDRNSKPFLYDFTEIDATLDRLIQEVDEDPTGIFWG